MRLRPRHRGIRYADCDSRVDGSPTTVTGRMSDRAKRAARRARRASVVKKPKMRPLEEKENTSPDSSLDVEFVRHVKEAVMRGALTRQDNSEGGIAEVQGTESESGDTNDFEEENVVSGFASPVYELDGGTSNAMRGTHGSEGQVESPSEEGSSSPELFDKSSQQHSPDRYSISSALPMRNCTHRRLQHEPFVFLWNERTSNIEPDPLPVLNVLGRLAMDTDLGLYVGQDDPKFLQKLEGKLLSSSDVERWMVDMTKPGFQRRVMVFYAFQLVLMPFLESPQMRCLGQYLSRAEESQPGQIAVFAGTRTCFDRLACDCGTYVRQLLE